MTTVILASISAPIVAGILILAARRGLPRPAADARGIALQSVIVIVVMLAIAAAVAGVLFSTSSEVTGELESQDLGTSIDTAAECTAHRMGAEPGTANTPFTTCTWQHDDVNIGSCRLVGGVFTPTTATAANRDGDVDATDDQCVLTV